MTAATFSCQLPGEWKDLFFQRLVGLPAEWAEVQESAFSMVVSVDQVAGTLRYEVNSSAYEEDPREGMPGARDAVLVASGTGVFGADWGFDGSGPLQVTITRYPEGNSWVEHGPGASLVGFVADDGASMALCWREEGNGLQPLEEFRAGGLGGLVDLCMAGGGAFPGALTCEVTGEPLARVTATSATTAPDQDGDTAQDADAAPGPDQFVGDIVDGDQVAADADTGGDSGSTSAGRRFLVVVLLLIPIFGVAVAVALALRAWRRRRLLGERHPVANPDNPWFMRVTDSSLHALTGNEADATPNEIRNTATLAAEHTTLADRDPDGRPTHSERPLHLRGTDAVHGMGPVDLVDSHHRAIGRLQPGNRYLARVVSGPWTLVQGADGVTGWVRTEHLTPGPPPPPPPQPFGPPTEPTGTLRHLRSTSPLMREHPTAGGWRLGDPLPPGDYLFGPAIDGTVAVYDPAHNLLGHVREADLPANTTLVPSGGPTQPPPPPNPSIAPPPPQQPS